MRDIRHKLIGMWLRAMDPRTGLNGQTRAHIEYILGNEYRLTQPEVPSATRMEAADDEQTHAA